MKHETVAELAADDTDDFANHDTLLCELDYCVQGYVLPICLDHGYDLNRWIDLGF
jgi:hypothetical protein